jgi:hypothetical protein
VNKNISGQKVTLLVIDVSTNAPKTGDAANLTAYVSKDDGSVTVLGDTSATELDATNAPGLYAFDLTQAETNADKCLFSGKSSTSNVKMIPLLIYTRPASFSSFVTPTGAAVNTTQIGGTSQTARDLGASVLLSVGTGTGQVNLASGKVPATIAAGDLATDSITAAALKADAVNEIADQVWEEAIAGHSGTAGSTAAALASASSAGDPWGTALPGAYASGTAGNILGGIEDFIDARTDAADTVLDSLPTNAELATALAPLATASALATVAGYVDTEVAAIKAKTDNLPASPAATSDIPSAATIATTVWASAARTLTAISDSSGVTTLLSRIGSALTISSGKVDADVKKINGTTVNGNGDSQPWGP